MKMEDGLHEEVPKTASSRTILMEIVTGNVQVLILVLKKFWIFSRSFLQCRGSLDIRGQNLSYDPMTLETCYLACRDLLCAN